MPAYLERSRAGSRLRAPADASETRRIERWLATARVFLTVSALAAIYMDPTQLGHAPIAIALLGLYLIHGVLVMTLLRRREKSTPAFRLLVHSADIVWPAFISVFAEGPRSPFFLFFVFVLAAAAYRWGFWETLGTAAADVLLLWIESFVLLHAPLAPGGALPWHVLNGLRVNVAEFEPKRLFMLSVYLVVMGLLLGYLAEQQKLMRAEKAFVTRMIAKARVDAGLSGTLAAIFGEILQMYGASRLLIASHEVHSHRLFLGELASEDGASNQMRWLESSAKDIDRYLYPFPGNVCFVSDNHDRLSAVVLNEDGTVVPAAKVEALDKLRETQSFRSLITVTFLFGGDWEGRVFLFDPLWRGEKVEELRFLLDLVQQVGPAIYNVYLLHRLRRRAGAAERARFARELHDGAVQSLIGVELQVDVLKRQAEPDGPVAGELNRIQGLLREEVLKLRELMQQMKSIDVDEQRLLPVLRDAVERFQRETGVSARFVTDIDKLEMPQRVCREMVRIVQESLVNIRKHSGARHVLVRLTASQDDWRLSVEDDGKGFSFSGRFSQSELDDMGKGPMIIKERVHLIAGELTVESNPGQGARLEVSIPRNGEAEQYEFQQANHGKNRNR